MFTFSKRIQCQQWWQFDVYVFKENWFRSFVLPPLNLSHGRQSCLLFISSSEIVISANHHQKNSNKNHQKLSYHHWNGHYDPKLSIVIFSFYSEKTESFQISHVFKVLLVLKRKIAPGFRNSWCTITLAARLHLIWLGLNWWPNWPQYIPSSISNPIISSTIVCWTTAKWQPHFPCLYCFNPTQTSRRCWT